MRQHFNLPSVLSKWCPKVPLSEAFHQEIAAALLEPPKKQPQPKQPRPNKNKRLRKDFQNKIGKGAGPKQNAKQKKKKKKKRAAKKKVEIVVTR